MARTSYKRSSRPAGRKGPNAVGNLYPNISLIDPRVALRLPKNDRRKNNTVIAGLDPAIHGHKALAHNMHAESNAFRQRFVPQPVLRSSWLQLVMFGLEPDISLMDPRVALRLPEDDRRKNNTVIAGLDPAIHKHKALAHDMHAESNALRQSFAPQPMLRSSWQQPVIAMFFSSPFLCHSRA